MNNESDALLPTSNSGFSILNISRPLVKISIVWFKSNNESNEPKIDSRPIVTGDFTKNDVMKFFNYEIHKTLDNSDHLHFNGFFIGNSHVDLTEELNYLQNILNQHHKDL